MKKLISLCALAALYAGPVLAESPAAKVEAVTAPAAASVEKAKEEVTKMCEKLLANTVIEDYNIDIVG
jgi:hypothetical protein